MKKALIITSCTGDKKYDKKVDEKKVIYAGDIYFNEKKHGQDEKEAYLIEKHMQCKAYDMYVGPQYGPDSKGKLGPIKEAFELLKMNNIDNYDHYILSAGYGLIKSDKLIVPYDISFNYPSKEKDKLKDVRVQTEHKIDNYKKWGEFIKVRESLNDLIKNEDYYLIIFLLANRYTTVLDLNNTPLDLNEKQKVLYIDNKKNLKLNNSKNFKIIEPCKFDDGRYGKKGSTFNYKIRGYLFRDLVKSALKSKKDVFDYIYETDINSLIRNI